MKTLYLLRHAFAAPRELSLSDFDRPLDEKGRRQAEEVASYLQNEKITFDFVMCSAALRARETLEPLRPVIGTDAIDVSKSYYNSPEDQILSYLKQVSDQKDKVLYIGHNPGIAFTALKFTKVFPEILIEGVTPATLIGFQFPISHWKDLNWWGGEVTDLFQPAPQPIEPLAPKEL
ncbi:MAG TPA: histidine phosphatase family protein [Alphaproteobacteria bacterium]|nr:histidine phosphatase family protein [Alphaproteobacteria bacterium]